MAGIQVNLITYLNFKATLDISEPTPKIILENLSTLAISPPIFRKVWFEVFTPSGAPIHQGDVNNPDFTGLTLFTNPFVLSGNWPEPFGKVEWSDPEYIIKMYYEHTVGFPPAVLTKKVELLYPNGNGKRQDNFGNASVDFVVKCDNGKIYTEDTTNFTYNGQTGSFYESLYSLIYPVPDDANVAPFPQEVTNMPTALLDLINNGEGHVLNYYVKRLYDMGNEIFILIKYKWQKKFDVLCNINLCPLICEYEALVKKVEKGHCLPGMDYAATRDKLIIINSKLNMCIAAIQQPCAVDVPKLIEEIKKMGCFTCNCCGTKGINKKGGVAGINIARKCGDIQVNSIQQGDNLLFELSDMSYDLTICEGSLNGAKPPISIKKTVVGCKITWCLDLSGLNRSSSGNIVPPEGGIVYPNPYKLPIVADSSTTTYSPNIVAMDATSLVASWNNDVTLSAIAQAYYVSESVIGLNLMEGQELADDFAITMGPVYDDAANTYKQAVQFKDANDNIVPNPTFPLTASIQIDINGSINTYFTPVVKNYTELAAAVAAMSIPNMALSAVPFANNTNVALMALQTNVTLLNQAAVFTLTILNCSAIAIAANNQLAASGTAGGIVWFDLNTGVVLGKLAGYANSHNPFHMVRRANLLLVINGDTGDLMKIECTFPMYPTFTQISLPAHANSWSASPFISPTSQRSFFDVLFQHEDVYYDAWVYILESSSGQAIRFDPLSNAIENRQATQLVGKRPCLIANGFLYYCMFGNLENAIGISSGVDRWKILKVELAGFDPLATPDIADYITEIDVFGSDSGGEEAWIICRKWNSNQLFIIGKFGSIYEWDPNTDTRVDALNPTQTWNLGTGVAFKPTGATFDGDKMYLATRDRGSYIVDFTNWPASVAITALDDLVVNNVVNRIHTSIQRVPSSNILIVTFENGGNPGGIARYSLTGQFIDVITDTEGGFYNAVLFPTNGPVTPNGLVP